MPVDEHGSFVGEVILPSGAHTVEVAVLDPAGNGELFLRDLEFPRKDWFFVGISDLTMAPSLGGGIPDALESARIRPTTTTRGWTAGSPSISPASSARIGS